jgi:large subunit ribosomal protein L24e
MKCSYCTQEIEKGTGLMYVRKTGAVKYYCSDRCYNFDSVQHKKQRPKEIKELAKLAKK